MSVEDVLKVRRSAWEKLELERMKLRGLTPKSDAWKKKYKPPSNIETESLPPLPKNWWWASVSQIGFIISGQTPRGVADINNKTGIPWFKVGDMNTEGNEHFIHKANTYLTLEQLKTLKLNIQPEGTIIFPKRGGAISTNKKRILLKPSGYDLNTMGIFPVGVEIKYFWYWFQSVNLRSIADGAVVPQINHGDIEPLILPIAPPEQQKLIVAKIEKLFSHIDAGIAALNKSKQLLKQYRQSVLKAAVTGELTKQWREDNKEKLEPASELLERILIERREKWEAQQMAQFEAKEKIPKNDKWKEKYREPEVVPSKFFDSIPAGWHISSIDHITWDVRYGSSSKTNDESSGVPILRMGNIVDGQLDYAKLKYLPKDHKEFPDLLLEDGDLVFNRTNSAELVGKTAVYRNTGQDTSLASYLIRVRLIEGIVPDFVAFLINSSIGKAWIKSCVSQNVGQANVNGTKLKAFTIPIPSSEEQTKIVEMANEKFASSQRLMVELDSKLLKAQKTKQSILASAFSGNLV